MSQGSQEYISKLTTEEFVKSGREEVWTSLKRFSRLTPLPGYSQTTGSPAAENENMELLSQFDISIQTSSKENLETSQLPCPQNRPLRESIARPSPIEANQTPEIVPLPSFSSTIPQTDPFEYLAEFYSQGKAITHHVLRVRIRQTDSQKLQADAPVGSNQSKQEDHVDCKRGNFRICVNLLFIATATNI